MVKRNCLHCHKEFEVYPAQIRKGGGKYCSRDCHYQYSQGKNHPWYGMKLSDECKRKISIANRKGKYINCYHCGKKIYRSPSQISERNFCSRECFYQGKRYKPKRGQYFQCSNCGKTIYRVPRACNTQYHFCSQACRKGFQFIKKRSLTCKECGKNFEQYESYLSKRGQIFCSKKCKGMARKGKKNKTWKDGSSYKKCLWRFFSKYIRQRDGGVCISCGKVAHWKEMDAGHYIPKTASMAVYFHEKNVHCQCTYCNRWMHGNLSRYAIALRRKYGEGILEELDRERDKTVKITIPEYQRLIDHYKTKLKENNWEM